MIAEILSTGDEISTGAVIDSNSAHIAQQLEEAGIEVKRQSCVGDDMTAIVSILKEISERADICLVTGGLGPTQDDLTAEAASHAAGVELVLDQTALNNVEDFFLKRKRPVSFSNKKQAMLPKGAMCLYNPLGTAPGFLIKIGRCFFFFLPGVPYEMRRMLSDKVFPEVETILGKNKEYSLIRTISTFGLTESATGEQLADLTAKFPGVKLGFRFKFPVIQIKLYTRGKNKDKLKKLINDASGWTIHKIGKKIFSLDDRPMEAVVGGLLRKKKATLAVAESCTGGLLSHMLTNVPGSSGYFLFSGVTYSNDAKIKILGVSSGTLMKYGAVHEETVKEMAKGAKSVAGADYGLSTSGIAGPDGGTSDKPVGTVCIGIAGPDSVQGYRFNFSFGRRSMHKTVFAMKALDLLRLKLL